MLRVRTWLVALLAAAMVLSVTPMSDAATVAGPPFSDVTASTSYATAINALAATGVLNGFGNGLFQPSDPLTRAQFTKIVVAMAGKSSLATSLMASQPHFTDAASIPSWAWGWVNAAVAMGIIQGYPDGTYRAANNVTHAEAIAMLTRMLGDNGTVTGTWPDNYMLAGYNLGIVNGLPAISANTPTLRDEIAQMSYNAAFSAKYTAPGATTLSSGGGLYGENATDGGFPAAYTGAVTAVSATAISLSAKDASGNMPVVNVPFESSVTLAGVSGFNQLLGLNVLLTVDANQMVDYVQTLGGAASSSATINNGTITAAPAGYQTYPGGTTAGGVIVAVTDGSGNDYALLNNGQVLELGATTQVYVNTVQRTSFTPSAAAASLVPGASVTYATQNGVATSLYETATTIMSGRVTAVDAAGGGITVAYMVSKPEDTTVALTVPASATISLNGAAASLGDLQVNDIVDIQTVGDLTSAGTSVLSVAATRKTVSGAVTQVSAITGATGPENTFTLQPTSGAAETLTEDSAFSGASSLVIGNVITVALDAAGDARAVVSTAATASPVVRLTNYGSTTTPSGTVQTITVDAAGSSVTYDTAGNASPQSEVTPSGAPLAVGDFYVLTLQPNATVSALGYLAPDADNGHLTVYSVSPTAVVVKDSVTGSYTTIVSGAAYNAAGTYIGFTGLQTGDSVNLYSDSSSQYAIQDTSR